MNLKKLTYAGIALAMLGGISLPASAAPMTATTGLKAGTASPIDNVAYRRCWWRHGYRHCRYVRRYYGNYAYAPYYDDGYYGYGYGPSLGLYFGGGGRGWGGGRHFGGGHGHRR